MEYCDLKIDPATGKSKGFAYVNYSTHRSAAAAVEQLNGIEFPPSHRLKVTTTAQTPRRRCCCVLLLAVTMMMGFWCNGNTDQIFGLCIASLAVDVVGVVDVVVVVAVTVVVELLVIPVAGPPIAIDALDKVIIGIAEPPGSTLLLSSLSPSFC
eukprot:scaffold38231_cov19-Prasinocladus_malaysianus.AAC.1